MLAGVFALTGTLAGPAGSIEWRAPTPPCPDASEVEASVHAMAGRVPEAEEIRATAVVEPAGERWALKLTTEVGGRVQERALEADSCDALAKATAIVVAVAVDPIGAAHEVREAEKIATEPAPRPEVDVVAPPEPVPPRVEPVRAPTRTRPPVHVHLGVAGGIVIGAVPGVSGGPSAAVGLSVGRFRAELRGSWWAPREGSSGRATALVQLGTVAAVACGEPGPERVTFPICAGLEAGAMRARGFGVPNTRTQHLGWFAALVGAGVRGWVRPRVGLRADVEVAIPITLDRVVVGPTDVADPRVVHQNAPVGARALLGVEFRLR